MTNLEIIKYLATNNPARLAELLDDIYCCAWNASVYDANTDGARFSPNEIDDFGEWINQEANANFFYDHELEEWTKAIKNPYIEIAYPNNLVFELPLEGKDPNYMWNTDNNFNIIGYGTDSTVSSGFVAGRTIINDSCIDNMLHVEPIKGNAKCPHCGESYYTELYSTSTAVYYPPIYKDGVNINPDMNKSTTHYECLNCQKEFDI